MANILLIEDNDDMRENTSEILTLAGHHVETASNGKEGVIKAQLKTPELIICDIMMPELDGYGVLHMLNRDPNTNHIPFIFLTAKADRADVRKGMELGADDYVTKPFSPRELNARIKAVLRRRAPQMTDDPIESSGLRLDPTTHRVTGNNKTIELGPTEFKLLHYLMSNPERVHSRGQVLDRVWGDRVFVEDRTVDVHIRRLRLALEETGHENLIQTVRGVGYRFSSQ